MSSSVCAVINGERNDDGAETRRASSLYVPLPVSTLQSAEFHLPAFSVKAFNEPGVVVAYGPPKSGVTTLLASLLLELQAEWRLDGAIILTDRKTDTYMGNTMPSQIIATLDIPLVYVLRDLIDMQRERRNTHAAACAADATTGTLASHRPYRLALVVDDRIKDQKEWNNPSLQRNLRLAADANIMVLIGTSNQKLLGSAAQHVATHVFVTRAAAHAKFMAKTVFGSCILDGSNLAKLEELIRNTNKYEFLVGCLRADDNMLRSYISTKYVGDARVLENATGAAWRDGSSSAADDSGVTSTHATNIAIASFAMAPELIAAVQYLISSLFATLS